MVEMQDTNDVWTHLHREVQASRNAVSVQSGWAHWDMAVQYARMLADRLGIDGGMTPRKSGRPPL